jgi:hypothetical protein
MAVSRIIETGNPQLPFSQFAWPSFALGSVSFPFTWGSCWEFTLGHHVLHAMIHLLQVCNVIQKWLFRDKARNVLTHAMIIRRHPYSFVETANKEEAATSEHFFSIPPTVQKLVAGVGRVNRDAFFAKFDVGVPKDKSEKGNEQVLIMYNHEKSLPTKGVDRTLSVEDATEHCHSMKLVFTEPNQKHQCLAIAGQWESYHVYKYMRLPPGKDKKVEVDGKYDLRYVSRLHGDKGLQQQIPFPTNVKTYDETLVTYLSSLDKVLEELKPIAARAAKDNTIIVMVCNHGQSELLMNFACSCKARGLDLSQVLVFATDVETRELAEGLGLAAFYDSTVRTNKVCVC